ncbi:MAG: tetratricopeptide repeat protein [Magnetococcales bacterium]|nr:tetratricopeptide repeat protein [Magnetococcales bacterium]
MEPLDTAEGPLPDLESAHSGELWQLERLLAGHSRFVLIFAEYGERRYRDAVIHRLAEMGHPGAGVVMQPEWESSGPLRDALAALSPGVRVVHLLELGAWLRLEQGDRFCSLLNRMRESLGEAAGRPLLLWLGPSELRRIAIDAPDLWSWRSAVFYFSRPDPTAREAILPTLSWVQQNNLDQAVARQRIQRIDAHLASHPTPSWAVASLWQERGQLRRQLGEWETALVDLREACTLFEAQNDPHTAAQVTREMARVLRWRGAWEDALRLLQEEVLPVFAKLADRRACAATLLDIAVIQQEQGRFDEALRLYEEQCALFAALDDRRAEAITLCRIADIYLDQGRHAEALEIYRAQRAVFEQYKDTRNLAIAMGGIARIHHARGEWEEALRLYGEQMPFFAKLGDTHNRAITLFNMALVHQQRGERDEALRLCQESRTLFEQPGDSRNLALVQQCMAELENPPSVEGCAGLKE